MQPWRFISEETGDGAENMARDQAILQACNEGNAPPTFRLYNWSRPTLTLGYAQAADAIIQREACRKRGIPILRRPTGGLAVLHGAELTYSIISPKNHPRLPGGLRATLQELAAILLDGLAALGLPRARLNAANASGGLRIRTKNPACFAAANHFEITYAGKKLIGSAQRRMHHAFLQHGSLPISMNRELLNSLLLFSNEEERQRHLSQLKHSAIALDEILPQNISFDELKTCFLTTLTRQLGQTVSGGLTPLEKAYAQEALSTAQNQNSLSGNLY